MYFSTYQVLDFLCETIDFFGFVVTPRLSLLSTNLTEDDEFGSVSLDSDAECSSDKEMVDDCEKTLREDSKFGSVSFI